MDQSSRYELLDKLGAGSYAAVYRARDKELGREVAIKEIHAQYRETPHLLDRYWQEAQLLASVQHPNIVTVFDVVREKGWLVMELMQGNLSERLQGRQMDLRSLRTALAHCLRALKYLHSRGIIHGDIKPSNMMVDARKRIKIGDFGLARRVSDEDGSLIKGTTKYIAPEVVSEEFGPVTSASDLYSLGFAAYELMCGSDNFEDLFPGLSAFGRDKQMAWMMWHAAPDRKLPDISRVLEGVPPDLAHVVQKLTEKDPKKRYATADAALAELKVDQVVVKESKDQASGEQAPKKDRSRLMLALLAFTISTAVSVAALLMPSGVDTSNLKPSRKMGIIRQIDMEKRMLVVEDTETGIPEEFVLEEKPRIFLENERKNILLRELQAGDRVAINTDFDSSGHPIYAIEASRAVESMGAVTSIALAEHKATFNIEEGHFRGVLTLLVPDRAVIKINGEKSEIKDVLPGDQCRFTHFIPPGGKGDRILDSITIQRNIVTRGFVQSFTPNTRTLLMRYGQGNSIGSFRKELAKDCEITARTGATLKPEELQPNDRLEITYNSLIQKIRVTRGAHRYNGIIKEIAADGNSINVQDPQGVLTTFKLATGGEATITLDPVAISDLRINDSVEIQADNETEALTIDATRPVKNDRWAVIIGVEGYQDPNLSPIAHSLIDARMLSATLQGRYGFNKDRITLILDPTKAELMGGLQQVLNLASAQSQLIVYYCGHSYLSPDNVPYLAGVDFNWNQMKETGISLDELITKLNECKSEHKILLFDGTQVGHGKDIEFEPAGKTFFSKLTQPISSMKIIASCADGQRGYGLRDSNQGAFATALSEAYSGKADLNHDLDLTAEELEQYLSKAMSELPIQDGQTQTPVLLNLSQP